MAQTADPPGVAVAAPAGRHDGRDLVASTYRQVYRTLYGLCRGDAELAADLTQEVYRKAWQALPSFEGRSEASTWLFRIATTTFLQHVRRPRLFHPLDETGSGAMADPTPDAAARLMEGEREERVRRALLALPDELRFAVTARYWGDLPIAEIARLEDLTPMGMRLRLRRAMAALRRALAEQEP
jgi:RNA polymerase sigma-70 factor (ECF subfamily)